ncbi:LCP family protein [Halobacillus litoralis]|uniref:LCP family protein n=1 Tax=Halobacillus litoralis TaxID=45668 RepID=UPI001CFCAB2A|nr:LCP family protein [Halobacillus litoralis]
MSHSRSSHKQAKKRKRRKGIIAFLVLFFLLAVGYSGYEYLLGKHRSLSRQASAAEDAPYVESAKSIYQDTFKGKDNGDDQWMVLLLGIDQRGAETSRTDTIMLAQYDRTTKSTKIASLMRDLYVDIPGHGFNKLNAAFAIGGPELLRETIEKNFQIEPEYYSIVDFNGFSQIVDILSPDGLEIDVEKDMQYVSGDETTNINLKEGVQTLNGEELLGYVRFRSDARGDFGRVERQQKVLSLLKDEILSFQGVLKTPRLIGSIQPYIDTNISSDKVLQAGKDALMGSIEDMDMLSIPTDDNVWNERKNYPVGLVLNHDRPKTAATLHQFFGTQIKKPDVR